MPTKRWPEVSLSTSVAVCHVRMANDSINSTPWLSDKHKCTPNQKFFDTEATKNPKHWFHFGCPVYVLGNGLQQGHRQPRGGKWAEQARVGCYLGWSPHPRMPMLDWCSTSKPQECHHSSTSGADNSFHSVKKSTRQELPLSTWMEAAGFK